jgi:hypothetical protein
LILEALMQGVMGIALAVDDDLERRFAGMNVARRRGISQVVAAMLTVRSANMVELGNALPRQIARWEKRYQFVERVLGNAKTGCDAVMASFAGQVAGQLSAAGETLIVMMDQSHINDLNEVLLVSLGFRGRALPVAWRVKPTQGGIGFAVQKELLAAVKAMLPADAAILLCADRFYGTPALVDWCVAAGWDYRIRLKSNLTLSHGGGEMATGEVLALAPEGLSGARLCGTSAATNIFALHEAGHPEPWIIAMAAKPGRVACLDYGLRWGIEAMFSDYKSRGFGLMQSQIQRPDRLEKLILIMAIAMYWAVSCGLAEEAASKPNPGSKKPPAHSARSSNSACGSSEDTSPWPSGFQNSGASGIYEGW